MGLWVGHLAGDQGPGFNPDSVLLSSERFPCLPLSCLFGWAVLEGRAVPFLGCCWPFLGCRAVVLGGEAPPPSGLAGPSEQGVLARGASGGSCCTGRFSWFMDQLWSAQERGWAPAAEQGQTLHPSIPSEQLGYLSGHRQTFDFLILA